MKVYQGVRSTAENVPYVEVNKDTVYVRSNVERVEEVEFSGWEYEETQYSLRQYIESLSSSNDTESIALLLSMIMSEVDFLKQKVKDLEGSANQ